MPRQQLEVADIFRGFGASWRRAKVGHVSLEQWKEMSAIERCRTVALGGHVAACEDCNHIHVAYNSCCDRHCPKCQGAVARDWLAAREAELLPIGYFHLVFPLPGAIADIAYQNKAVIYDLLLKTSAETTVTIAADPKHLGARIGVTAVLHTWGSAMTHHPHVHMIVPGDGISLDGKRWVSSRAKFFLSVHALSHRFQHQFLEKLMAAHKAGRLMFFGKHTALGERAAFEAFLKPFHKSKWVVYAKPPFGGPETVLAYLAQYTHRIAISNSRLIKVENDAVTFKCKDYRKEGPGRYGTMTLPVAELIRRFLMHVLPKGFHRSRHYGLLANGNRVANVARARELLGVHTHTIDTDMEPDGDVSQDADDKHANPCPCCGGSMVVIEVFEPGCKPKHHPITRGIDSS